MPENTNNIGGVGPSAGVINTKTPGRTHYLEQPEADAQRRTVERHPQSDQEQDGASTPSPR